MSPDAQHPRRPPRLQNRIQTLDPFYFVTFNTHKRTSCLANANVHRRFAEFCSKALSFNVAVGRYVIMPDHIHLFVKLPVEGMLLSRWVGSLKSFLGKELGAGGYSLPHWQEGFFDHLMRSSESYGSKWAYVEQNPVRAGLCLLPEEWPYQGEFVSISF